MLAASLELRGVAGLPRRIAGARVGLSRLPSPRLITTTTPWSVNSRGKWNVPSCNHSLHTGRVRSQHIDSGSARPRTPTPLDEITRLRQLINRANATNSSLDKGRILSEFADLQLLLSFLYDPYCRLHLTSAKLDTYLRQRKRDEDWQTNQAPYLSTTSNRSKLRTRKAALRSQDEQVIPDEQVPATLIALFELLSSRRVTGNRALATIKRFLEIHGILEQHEYALSGADDPNLSTTEIFRRGLLRPTALEIFSRCLDRNLRGGFSEKILHQAFRRSTQTNEKGKGKADGQDRGSDPASEGKHSISGSVAPSGSQLFKGSFQVALGKAISRAHLPSLFVDNNAPAWYASRKLDGVRCLFVVECKFRGDTQTGDFEVVNIQSLSRNGRPFATLEVLEDELRRHLPSCQTAKQLLFEEHRLQLARPGTSEKPARPLRLILDGEVCVLTPPEKASDSAVTRMDAELAASTQSDSSATNETSSQRDLHFVEDFAAVVGLIKRKDFTIPNPAFFPFDLLTAGEFINWRAQDPGSRTFSDRIRSVEELVSHFALQNSEPGSEVLIRPLPQSRVSSAEEVEAMLSTASARGWEGLILRQDVPYEGKRTSCIRKFKEWKDAEYTVQDISVASMRLPISGEFQQRQAMAAIYVDHRGTRVAVGSGFTPQQRVAFAENPELIRGKTVTVEYFEESCTTSSTSIASTSAAEDAQGAQEKQRQQLSYSLRFPRIKHIWDQGRDV
ncbi:hypothetical protein BCV70DRAFT_197422 [Testicularia cyperi]|uniref:ATP-dependent DNA ligase family profile domain-containing protein n=1 Tax=Testicularia cyperi TaxID=1882483 RepID=A0A317Y0N2_9BASI|nr:hypothetical protein BCV70DRAFT_197422 [Testicularia cyperi]